MSVGIIPILFSLLTLSSAVRDTEVRFLPAYEKMEAHFEVIHNFTGLADGGGPLSPLLKGNDGCLYGTVAGGTHHNGTVFKIDHHDKLHSIYTFEGPKGAEPFGPLVCASDGNIYGTTQFGGANNQGIIYKLENNDELSVVHHFNGPDGSVPISIAEVNGTFFGTTGRGGAFDKGIIFTMDLNGNVKTVYNFSREAGAEFPLLLKEFNHELYGISLYGEKNFAGTLFQLYPNNTLHIIFDFDQHNTAMVPTSITVGPCAVTSCIFTAYGHAGSILQVDGKGIYHYLFFNPIGLESVLSFTLMIGSNNRLLGTAVGYNPYQNGTAPCGGIFSYDQYRLQSEVLHSFQDDPAQIQGCQPKVPPTEREPGVFYGTVYNGGPANAGVVYKLTIPSMQKELAN